MSGSGMGGGVTVAIARAADKPGLDIVDPIERRRCTLLTDGPVVPREADPEAFLFPVDTAVEIETTGIRAPFIDHAHVRDEHCTVITELIDGCSDEFRRRRYSIDLPGLIKVYIEFDAAFSASQSSDGLEITFPAPTTVNVGSRSLHTQPGVTVETTDDPTDLLAAISTFGSALKTTSPERAFPTLRGHPPALEVGDELTIPEGVDAPVTDVRVEVPPRDEFVYPVAPLAYYLGVRAEPGHVPRLVVDGRDYVLDHPEGFSRKVHEVLKQVFLFDCATRTEGYYPVDLYERRRIENRVDLPFADLYDAPMVDRLHAYLDVPFSVISDIVPTWRLAAHVEPCRDSIPMLSYLANDLALVTMAEAEPIPEVPVASRASGFTRGSASSTRRGNAAADTTFVKPIGGPEASDTAWVSDGAPVGATKAVPAAYRNRFGRTPQTDSISIAVVCNSPNMADEHAVVNEVYGQHQPMPFDIELHQELTRDELASLLARDFNFFHYIGHIDDAGFRCADDRLDVTELDAVAPEAFFLNACQSYDQGLGLIRGGAIGGIVTHNDVVNQGAVRIGHAVARLLNGGFPLRAALDLASQRSVIGRQYLVVGDGTLSIVQPPGGTSHSYELSRDGSSYRLRIRGYGSPPGMGCLNKPYLESNDCYYLAEGDTREFFVSDAELSRFLRMENIPVEFQDELHWSFEFDAAGS